MMGNYAEHYYDVLLYKSYAQAKRLNNELRYNHELRLKK